MTLYIYYNSESTDLSSFELEAIVNDCLYDYIDTGSTFGYVDDECRSYGNNISFGSVYLNDDVEDFDIDDIIDMITDEFIADGVEIVDIQYTSL